MPPCDIFLPIGDGGGVWHAITRRQALVDGQFQSPNLALSRDLVENSTARGVFFTQLEFSSQSLPWNKTQAAQYRDSGTVA